MPKIHEILQGDADPRLEIASRILAGFCANPSVFASNPNSGWSLVNASDEDLVGYSIKLAADLLEANAATLPTNA